MIWNGWRRSARRHRANFVETIATGALIEPAVAATLGGVLRLELGQPDIRMVREGRPAAGRGWIGISPRGAYVTEDVQVTPLLPGWLYLLLVAGLAIAAWLVEGRRPNLKRPA